MGPERETIKRNPEQKSERVLGWSGGDWKFFEGCG